MNTNTTRQARCLAALGITNPVGVVAGIISTGAALAILTQDAIRTGVWTLEHGLMPALMIVCILSASLAISAARQRSWISALGFAVVSVAATFGVVYTSVGKQSEVMETKALAAEYVNGAIDQTAADLEVANRSLWQQTEKRNTECQGAPAVLPPNADVWPKCRRLRGEVEATEARIAKLQGSAKDLGPKVASTTPAQKFAKVWAFFTGANEVRAAEAFALLQPFMFSLIFELCALLGFHFGFGHRPIAQANGPAETAEPSARDSAQTSFPNGSGDWSNGLPNGPPPKGPVDLPNGSGSPRAVLKPKRSDRKDEVLAALLTANALGQSFGSQREATERFDVPASTFSEWMKEWEAEGLIPKRRMIGRCKVMS